VTLDTVIGAFNAGATAEEIVQQYPSIALADVYSVIAYYLRHQADVQTYLAERQQQAAKVPRGERTRVRFTRHSGTGSSHVADSWSRPFCGSPPTRTSTTM
jgi:hypothetical protein